MTNLISKLLMREFGVGKRTALRDDVALSHQTIERPRPRVGLALSSGAAKGLAHIGVIQVLEEHGIEIDAIAGSSMGAYVGSIWACGNHGERLEELAATVRSKKDTLALLDPVFPPRRGFVKGEKVRQRLAKSIGEYTFESLEKELHVVTTELDTLRRVTFSSGPILDAVHASIAIPGFCEPVTIDGVEYTDGGVSDPLPVNILKDRGVDIVIAVCVMPTATELLYKKRKLAKTEPKGWRSWANKHLNYWAEGNIFNIQRSSDFGSQMRLAELSMKSADIKIRPIVCDAKWHDYAGYQKYIAVGREATLSKIGEIKALIGSKQKGENIHDEIACPLG